MRLVTLGIGACTVHNIEAAPQGGRFAPFRPPGPQAPRFPPRGHSFAVWISSGVNVHQTGPDFLRDRDAGSLTAWIDNYCRRNPLHHVNQAVFELLDVLQAGAPLTPVPVPPARPR